MWDEGRTCDLVHIEGDVLVVTKLDRLARNVPHLCEIGSRLDTKGVGLKVLDQAIDTTTPTGRLMFNMLGAIAQFERELIRERMLVGIAKAKADTFLTDKTYCD